MPAAAYEELEAPAAAAVCLLEVDEAAVGVRRVDEPSPPWTCSLADPGDVEEAGKLRSVLGRLLHEYALGQRAGGEARASSWPWRSYWGSARGSSSTELARRAARRHLGTVHLVAAGSARAQPRVSLCVKHSVFRSAKRLELILETVGHLFFLILLKILD